jgi:hypothetical protein
LTYCTAISRDLTFALPVMRCHATIGNSAYMSAITRKAASIAGWLDGMHGSPAGVSASQTSSLSLAT